ncbi:MAG: putative sugar transferase EpsL [candidate division BRC1 bacterium ADurb.BinA292]|nr:MAG: putative sugar transferase EpsL [candidate division BRC1 bacterium ADurb.BinA292]
MLRESQYILRQVNIALDLLLGAAAFLIAHALRALLSIYIVPGFVSPSTLGYYLWLLPAGPLAIVLVLAYNGAYRDLRLRIRTAEQARRIATSCFEAALILVGIDFLFGGVEFLGWRLRPAEAANTSRAILVLFPLVAFALLTGKAWLLRRFLMAMRRRGLHDRRVILVGSGAALSEFAETIAHHPIWGLNIVGIVTDRPDCQGAGFDPDRVPESTLGWPILADLERAPAVLWRTPIDEVIFLPESAPLASQRPLLEICEEMGVRTHLPLNFFSARIAHPVIDRFEETPVLSYWPTQPIGPALLFKYAFDRIAAVILLVLASPVMLATAIAIRLTSRKGEPIIFSQQRVGLNGRLFTCWKFRSMRSDAEMERETLEQLNEQQGPVFKMRHDPRITPLGRFLRKFSIDELPQLWNVVRGEMSLVGPRPPLPQEIEKYDRWQRRRLSMKPGLTCIWQVSGRNLLPFDTWMKLDLEYIDNWSLLLDFKILARTVYVVLTGYGAM